MADCSNKDPFKYEEEKREFIDGLRQFHLARGTPFDKVPKIGSREVDLYLLYRRVTSLGGWQKVTEEQRWEELFTEFRIPRACLNGEHALKYLYIRYLNIYEKIHFLGEDPNHTDVGTDHDAPARKKLCLPLYGVPLSYNHEQHRVADNLRSGFNMSTDLVKFGEYDKLEKALLSGLSNEVDFVVNVCTLLSNESKHTLRLDKSRHLLDLLLGHIGIFNEGAASLEQVYEHGWKKQSQRDFLKFWYDTVKDDKGRKLISSTRVNTKRSHAGEDMLYLGRDLGIDDKEGIRITQLAIILRNLSFDDDNMKYLAANGLVFRFLMLCTYCSYGTVRQLSLDTLGNLAARILLDPEDSFMAVHMLELLVKCLTSLDKFAVVRGLEMLSKLSQSEANEFVLAEKLEDAIYDVIVKYLTVQDIQLIVSSLEALYQLSELGEATSTKIAEVSSTVDVLVGLITVEAQSYGPNSLVGIKVVEYCPPPHLTGGAVEGTPGAPGPPPTPAQPPGSTGTSQLMVRNKQPVVSTDASAQGSSASSDMETATCNWLQATYEFMEGKMVSQLGLYSEYLNFCKKFSLPHALAAQSFFTSVSVVFPKAETVSCPKDGGSKEMCVRGLCKKSQPQPFSIPCQVGTRPRSAPFSHSLPLRPSNSLPQNASGSHTPMLLQRLSEPLRNQHQNSSSMSPTGGRVMQINHPNQHLSPKPGPPEMPTLTGPVPPQGYLPAPAQAPSPVPGQKGSSKSANKKSGSSTTKKPQHILPRQSGQYPIIMPKTSGTQNAQLTSIQTGTIPMSQEVIYQTVYDSSKEASETKMVKTLLAKKLLGQYNPVTVQGNVSYGEVTMNVDTSVRRPEEQFQIQYQTSAVNSQALPVQQATFIQYARPVETLQPGVQAIVNSNQTSNLQTFVMQPGVIVQQNIQPASSSLQPTIIAQQQSIPVSAPVADVSTSCKKAEKSSSSSKCKKGASSPSQNKPSHSTQPSSPLPKCSAESVSSQDSLPQSPQALELEVCGAVERAKDVVQEGIEARIERVENKCLQEHYEQIDSNSVQVPESKPSIEAMSSENNEAAVKSIPQSGDLLSSVSDGPDSAVGAGVSVSGTVDSGVEDQSAVQTLIDTVDADIISSAVEDETAAQALLDEAVAREDAAAEEMENAIGSIMEESLVEEDGIGEECDRISLSEAISACIGDQADMEDDGEDLPSTVAEPSVVEYLQAGQEEDMSADEEPVMIENDGNELLFEQGYKCVKEPEPLLNGGDCAVEQMQMVECEMNGEQMEAGDVGMDAVSTQGVVESVEDAVAFQEDMGSVAALVNSEGLSAEEGETAAGEACAVESGAEEGLQLEVDEGGLVMAEVIQQQEPERAPPVQVSRIVIQSENGLYEQDLEARMAVENLLKDVEFNVNGDDTCSEEDVAVYSSQQDNPGSVQTDEGNDNESLDALSSETGSGSMPVQGKGGLESHVTSSSQSRNKGAAIASSKDHSSLPRSVGSEVHHVSQNGIAASKPFMNGNVSSPEYSQSDLVPSPVYSDRGNDLKSVNGISDDFKTINKTIDKVSKLNGVVNHKFNKGQTIEVYQNQVEERMEVESPNLESKAQGDILAQSILVNGIQPSDADIPDTEPMLPVVKQLPANTIIGNIVTVNCLQVPLQATPNMYNTANNLTTVSVSNCFTFTNNALIASKVQLPSVSVCNSRLIPTPESSRDSELSCDSTASSSTVTTDLNIILPDKHSMSVVSHTPKTILSSKDSSKPLTSPDIRTKSTEGKGSKSNERKPKKRNRSKSGGSSDSSKASPANAASVKVVIAEFMCEWAHCKKCFDNARSVFCHVCAVHLKMAHDGLCKWEGCEALVRKRWSLFTHVQDHHCSEGALRAASQRRLQALQTGQTVPVPAIPAMVYPQDAAVQAIRRFIPKPPYQEFTPGREGPVTKHIRLTAALILRNLARYSAVGRSLIKKHERVISYSCMSEVEASTALANCLFEILHDSKLTS